MPPDHHIPVVQIDESAPKSEVQEVASQISNLPAGIAAPGRKITLHFSLTLESGEEVDSCFNRDPVSFVLGDGSMLAGFEQALLGKKAGAEIDALIEAEQAFGTHKQDNIQSFPRFRFPPDLELIEGLMIDFGDSAGNSQAGVVLSFDSSDVEIDFNHPLAGRNILFRAHLYEVAEASDTDDTNTNSEN